MKLSPTRAQVSHPVRPAAISAPSLIPDSTQPTSAATGTHVRTVIPRANSRAASVGLDQGGHRLLEAVSVVRDLVAHRPSPDAAWAQADGARQLP